LVDKHIKEKIKEANDDESLLKIFSSKFFKDISFKLKDWASSFKDKNIVTIG